MADMGLSQQASGGGQEEQMKQLIMQVVQLLQQGRSPEELLQMGVPKEVIQYAMQMLQQGENEGAETGATQQAEQQGGGLSQQQVR